MGNKFAEISLIVARYAFFVFEFSPKLNVKQHQFMDKKKCL
jgi:hypothetical protein